MAEISKEAQGNNPSAIKSRTRILSEVGPQLPIGLAPKGGTPDKALEVKRFSLKEERALGSLREANKTANLPTYVAMILGEMCARLGPHVLGPMDPVARRVAIGQMAMGDVFYAYVWLRVQAMGEQLKLNIKCPHCNHEQPFVGDLRTMEVVTLERPDDGRWTYKLKAPMQIRGKDVTGFQCDLIKWTAVQGADATGANVGAAKAAMIRGAISGLITADGKVENQQLADGELDEMSKRDVEAMTRLIDLNSTGPVMSVEDICKQARCRKDIKVSIDWGYDSFFADSSL